MTGRPRPAGGVEGSTAQEPQRGAPEPLRFFTGRTAWFAILGAAAVARLLFVALSPNVWQFLDSREYEDTALSLYQHGTYGLHTVRAPGYPTLIAAVYVAFGPHLVALRLVEAALAIFSVAWIGVVATRVFGPGAGLLSAALAALHPVLAFLPTIQYAENTLVFVVVLAFGAVFEAWRRGGLWRWAGSGVLWGLALLVRPNTVFALPGLAVGLGLALHRERRGWWAPALVGITACALTLAPWIVRSHRVHGDWFFIATGGGRQIWIGNNPLAEADSRVAGFVPDSLMQAETSRLPNDIARERYLYRLAFTYMRAHPGRTVVLYLREVRNLLAFYPETRSRVHINMWSRMAQGLATAVMFAGALIAIFRLRSDPALRALACTVASFVLGSAFYFAILRYRMTVEPCLLWMAGAGWEAVLSRRTRPAPETAPSTSRA